MNIYDGQLAISGGVLHHIGLLLAAEESRCSWCHAELMRLPNPNRQESHGICQRHLAQIKADLELKQRAHQPGATQRQGSQLAGVVGSFS